jgi:phospholipid/cholesterol/gamma-HCH transport system ATP-binding protein
MIQVKNLEKHFGDNHVLKDITIDYKPGECSLIIGASGSGKTVLLKSLVGLHEPDSGEIWYDKVSSALLTFNEKKNISKEIGMLFQGSALFDFATVEENVRFPMDFFTEWSDSRKAG